VKKVTLRFPDALILSDTSDALSQLVFQSPMLSEVSDTHSHLVFQQSSHSDEPSSKVQGGQEFKVSQLFQGLPVTEYFSQSLSQRYQIHPVI